jgi:hypothetical protein
MLGFAYWSYCACGTSFRREMLDILLAQAVYVFYVIREINSSYFPQQYYTVGLPDSDLHEFQAPEL